MASIALFHSALGVRPGITDAAARLRAAGHDVLVVDQCDGQVFDDYAKASAYVERIGFPALMQQALDAVRDLPDGFVAAGFSNGAGMAEHVATQRRCGGALLFSGALPLAVLGADAWPGGVPVQLHYGERDPLRSPEWVDAFVSDVRRSGSPVELVDHPVTGHLFTDPSLPAEYDEPATELLWSRALAFLARIAS
ncbi:dienelactone hydrolase family protein [Geodermatophilus ruber]|uniref:Dienelactone hydrolase n=1 Tax=Geodermatophilus ruber TaxID=504800 RepID=A0A1I3YHD7_9ACTN|nr:dienelactone hydrolase family protein [Geodermatophilus ruber]SFK30701.1 Dienelactone hydrolase [Geodermatophilus ruber]